MNIRFMTYNIQHGMDHARYLKDRVHVIDLGLTAKVISRYKPDIVGLNEVRDRGAHAEYRCLLYTSIESIKTTSGGRDTWNLKN